MHLTAPTLTMMGRSQEIADCLIDLKKYPDDPQRLLAKYGIPPMLYGIKVVQEPDGALPPNWIAVVSDNEPHIAVIVIAN